MAWVAVAASALDDGGFDVSSRSLFVILAGLTLLTAGLVDSRSVSQAARSPQALTLIAIGALSAASSIWTIGTPTDALRWGLVIAGYAAILIGAATLAGAKGPGPIAAAVAALALVESVLGLRAVAFHALPDAERIVRSWEPGGTFEYPPALAILEAGALPILAVALDRCRSWTAGTAAATLVLAGAVLRLSDSRLGWVVAAVLLLALLIHPPSGRRPRAAAAGATLLVLAGGLLAPAIFGGNVGPTAPGAGAAGLGAMLGIAALAGIGWAAARRTVIPSGRRTRRLALAGVTSGAIALSLVAITSQPVRPPSHAPSAKRVSGPSSDLLHGRSHEWLAAIQTWLDRPWLGAGAGAYYIASLPHQTVARSLYAHNLPLELGAELGLLGLVLGVALYASAGWTLVAASHRPDLWLLGPIVVAFLVSNLVDWTWHLAGLGAVWAAASGALVATAPVVRPAPGRA